MRPAKVITLGASQRGTVFCTIHSASGESTRLVHRVTYHDGSRFVTLVTSHVQAYVGMYQAVEEKRCVRPYLYSNERSSPLYL
jgi:hypothetical protein